ncbi:cutinase family protein [Mycobacteroides chelonae]|uniref:Cutinase family protein n=1 Tax=Mycobacteroides chelonae TaxID=1774 RepID=A0AB73TW73_MYCCH|nr:cutinase family protein [Mycobacteroides chelonae]MEC4841141.1 cutinase family protein [Mycobacteroides chelonae]MEC4845821.1 cutinase family protein [Mycobacteroides chelonae]OLT78954.1 cutinase [Mycobacteroides chelonae]QDF68903.1 cutinase family protein [Mycobacteroides chelonae]WED90546.1 cutinase family protein [Mycobacteroides chelonae]
MPKTSSSKRHRILGLAAALAVAVVVILVIAIIVVIVRRPDDVTPPAGQVTTTPPLTRPGQKPRPAFQSADCPDVQALIIPGTWESSRTDDPLNPTEFPRSLLLNVSRPITEKFDKARLETWTVPYTAQFHNPFANDNQMSYNDSRKEGTDRAVKQLSEMYDRCPLTSYVLVGFSQGAVIAGDIANQIGNGEGPVDQDLVLGVTLIADGRRQDGVGLSPGPNPPGQGAEVTLGDLGVLDSFGLKMSGPRPGGFGELNDRTNQICGTGDLICAAPPDAFNISNLGKTLDILSGGAGAPVHALYATPEFWQIDGQPATVWTTNWAEGLIEKAPHPKHG